MTREPAQEPAAAVRPGSGAAWLLILLCLTFSFVLDRQLGPLRLSGPLLLAGLLATFACAGGLPLLQRAGAGQVIRSDGPRSHLRKGGTPTMGGLLLVPCGVLVGVLVAPQDPRLPVVACVTLAFMAIGGIDDWRSLRRQANAGLTPTAKLLLQALLGATFLLWCGLQGWMPQQVSLPWGWELPLGILIWPLGLFVFLAESNATNLLDGLDGLAAGCGALVLLGLAAELMLRPLPDPGLAGFCAAMAGAWLAFLLFNRQPARMFMGDTGSLAMGACLSAVALLADSLPALLVMGALLVAESLSVVLQVGWFKLSRRLGGEGRRLLRMAPLHHHFELGGWSEQRVVLTFWTASALCVSLGLLIQWV